MKKNLLLILTCISDLKRGFLMSCVAVKSCSWTDPSWIITKKKNFHEQLIRSTLRLKMSAVRGIISGFIHYQTDTHVFFKNKFFLIWADTNVHLAVEQDVLDYRFLNVKNNLLISNGLKCYISWSIDKL